MNTNGESQKHTWEFNIVQKMIFWTRYVQTRNQLGTPVRARSFLRGAQIF